MGRTCADQRVQQVVFREVRSTVRCVLMVNINDLSDCITEVTRGFECHLPLRGLVEGTISGASVGPRLTHQLPTAFVVLLEHIKGGFRCLVKQMIHLICFLLAAIYHRVDSPRVEPMCRSCLAFGSPEKSNRRRCVHFLISWLLLSFHMV